MQEHTGDKRRRRGALTNTRQEMKRDAKERVAEIAKELADGFEFLEDYPKSVTFFGSNRAQKDNPYYDNARKLSSRIVKELGYSVVSGGGPGIMEAADRGAYEAGGNSLGLLISIPGELVNTYITESLGFHYFFTRKVCLSFGAEVFIFYPGGFGTLDEFFELLVLLKTKKMEKIPIICVGAEYWNKLKKFIEEDMLNRGAITEEEMGLFQITDDHDEIIKIIKEVPVRIAVPLGDHGETHQDRMEE